MIPDRSMAHAIDEDPIKQIRENILLIFGPGMVGPIVEPHVQRNPKIIVRGSSQGHL